MLLDGEASFHLFTSSPFHLSSVSPFHLFTLSTLSALKAKHLFTFLPFHPSTFPPFQLSKGHQAKGTKTAFEQCFNISRSVTAYMYSCSNLAGTVFQMIWNEVPDKLEHEYKTYVTRPLLNSCVIYT